MTIFPFIPRKKRWLLLLLFSISFSACSITSAENQLNTNTPQTVMKIHATQMMPTTNQADINQFPFEPGTVWVYIKTGFSQAEDKPGRLIHGIVRIEEQVVDSQNVPPYTIVHIEGKKGIISADDAWVENGIFELGDYEYWYVVQGDMVYLSYQQPDPIAIQLEGLSLAYAFPFRQGTEWCGSAEASRNSKNSTPLPDPPCFSSKVVRTSGSYVSPVGEIEDCYEIHELSNSGNVITQYCNGIGVVAVHYNHGGTRFGFSQELVQWTNGQEGSSYIAQDPTFSALYLTPTITLPITATPTPDSSQ